jgi:hypothetical protein
MSSSRIANTHVVACARLLNREYAGTDIVVARAHALFDRLVSGDPAPLARAIRSIRAAGREIDIDDLLAIFPPGATLADLATYQPAIAVAATCPRPSPRRLGLATRARAGRS